MTTPYPGAYLFSALLHGAVAVLVLFFAYAANRMTDEAPKVFDLVAGAGNNYAATAAPALGSPNPIKVAQSVTPEPAPIQAAPAAAAPAPAKPVDLVKSLERAEARRERNLEAKFKKQQEAEAKKEAQAELQRQKEAKSVRHIDAAGIREGVIGGSAENRDGGAGGKALTREQGDELDAYFALLKNRITENAEPLEGVSDTLQARVEFFIAADGSISHVRILASSGNHEFDRSAIGAVERTPPIGPRPDGKSDTRTLLYRLHSEDQ
jgi:colicin import membrane protein